MKNKQILIKSAKILAFTMLCIVVLSCKKKEVNEDLVIDDNSFQHNYTGSLIVNFTNTMPEFGAVESMDVEIDTLGFVTIESGTLEYSGITLVSDDSKLERNGKWNLAPTGHIVVEGGITYVKINAGINIDFDETKVYAKDNYGTWILVSEFAVAGTPNSDLGAFNFNDAVNGGTTNGVEDQFGNIEWTLILYIAD